MTTKQVLLFLFICIPFYSVAVDDIENETEISINFNKNRPRTPDVMDCTISGYYSNGVVYLYFNEAIGETSVEISNTDTGENWTEMFSAPSACEQVFIGNVSGDYSIYITTDCGDTYIGFFQL